MKITESHLRRLIRSRLLRERSQTTHAEEGGESAGSEGTGSSTSSGSSSPGSFSGATGGGQGRGERETQGSTVVIKLPGDDGTFSNPNLVYVYPGIGRAGYGRQAWVARKIRNTIGLEPNTVIVVAAAKDTSWSDFKDDGIDAYKSATGEDQECWC
jgi:hypothetical protein